MSDSLQPHGLQHRQASLSLTNSRSLLKLMCIESVIPSNHLILGHPLILLPSVFPSSRIFSNEPVLCIRWPKYWSFSFSNISSKEYSGLISFRMDWLKYGLQGIKSHKLMLLNKLGFFIYYINSKRKVEVDKFSEKSETKNKNNFNHIQYFIH